MTSRMDPIAPIGGCREAEPFALQVIDDSMAPEFAKGCIVVIDPGGRATHGSYVFAEYEGTYIFRRLEMDGSRVLLRALNDAYPPIRIRGKEELLIEAGRIE